MGGEEFEGGDTAEVSPMIAVWGPRQASVVVAQVFTDEEAGAVGKNEVVLLGEAFLGG